MTKCNKKMVFNIPVGNRWHYLHNYLNYVVTSVPPPSVTPIEPLRHYPNHSLTLYSYLKDDWIFGDGEFDALRFNTRPSLARIVIRNPIRVENVKSANLIDMNTAGVGVCRFSDLIVSTATCEGASFGMFQS